MRRAKKSLEQILRARAAMDTVLRLLDLERLDCDPTSPIERVRREAYKLAWLAVRDADRQMSHMEEEARYSPTNETMVDLVPFDLLANFRSIGTSQLQRLLDSKRFQREYRRLQAAEGSSGAEHE